MIPQIGHVFNQKLWPQVGDYDDCWAVSDLMAVHSVAPWLALPGMTPYRLASGNPDDPNIPDGGTIAQSATAIRKLFPLLVIEQISGGSWIDFITKVKIGRPASLCVRSSLLPLAMQYGYTGFHRIMVAWDGSALKVSNPLARAHSAPVTIAEASLQKAVYGYDPGRVWAVLMPTVETAFKTHPLHVA